MKTSTSKEGNNANPYKEDSFSEDKADTGTVVADYSTKKDLKMKLNSMMAKVENEESKFKCSVCGRTTTGKNAMRKHIETHIDDLTYSCHQCNKVSRSSDGFRRHISREHHKKFL